MSNDELLEKEDHREDIHYRRSLWWVTHRELVKAVGYILFVTLDVMLICVGVWSLTNAFLISYDQDQAQVAAMVSSQGQADLNAQTVANAAKPLLPGTVQIFADENNTVDVYAPLSNPNADWWAEFDYVFSTGSDATDQLHGFILPGQQNKPILALAATHLSGAVTASLTLQNVVWHRVDNHVTGDYATWAAPRLMFTITNASFNTTVPFAGKTIGQSTFTIDNAGSFSYYNPVFDVLLMRGSTVVGVSRTTLESIDAGASQHVSISWFGALPAVGGVDVEPDINIFDPSVYKPLTGGTSIDAREPGLGS